MSTEEDTAISLVRLARYSCRIRLIFRGHAPGIVVAIIIFDIVHLNRALRDPLYVQVKRFRIFHTKTSEEKRTTSEKAEGINKSSNESDGPGKHPAALHFSGSGSQ